MYIKLISQFHNMSGIVRETCDAIHRVFKGEVKTPRTPDEWHEVAEGFSSRWNIEHCIGALDGKHVAIKKPPGSGSTHYNYKGFCSIVLMGIVDADYKFIWTCIGPPGSESDGGIWKQSDMYSRVEEGMQGILAPEPFPGHRTPVPWFFNNNNNNKLYLIPR